MDPASTAAATSDVATLTGAPARIRHGLGETLRFSPLMIAAGCKNGNGADSLRHNARV